MIAGRVIGWTVAVITPMAAVIFWMSIFCYRMSAPSLQTLINIQQDQREYEERKEQFQASSSAADIAWHKAKDYDRAERLFLQAISLDAGDAFVKIAFAQMLTEQRRYEESYLYYRDAIHPYPSDTQPSGLFHTITFFRYARAAQEAGMFEEAHWARKEIVLNAHKEYPDFPSFTENDLQTQPIAALATLVDGLSQEQDGKKEEALTIFQSVVKRYPHLALAHRYVEREQQRTTHLRAVSTQTASVNH